MNQNYTPLNTEKLSPKKKSFKLSNKVLIGLILFFAIGVGTIGYLITRESLQTNIPAHFETTVPTATPSAELTSTPEVTLTLSVTQVPEATPTIEIDLTASPTAQVISQVSQPVPTATPIPVACGTKSCDISANPCRSGLICVQANDGSNYCSLPEFETACKNDPSQSSCCTAPGQSPTPTEIVLVQATATPGQAATSAPQVAEIPSAGVATFSKILLMIGAVVILLGFIF